MIKSSNKQLSGIGFNATVRDELLEVKEVKEQNEKIMSIIKRKEDQSLEKMDNGLIPIFKEQRQKYNAICKVVNTVKSDLLSITDFDEVIKEVHPSIYEWYVSNVVAQHHS